MKSIKLAFAVAGIAVLSGCSAIKTDQNATVIKDCTGTYLRIDAKDYLVCNSDILKNHNEGSKVTATFTKVKECPEFEGKVVCMMYHANEGMIRIKNLK